MEPGEPEKAALRCPMTTDMDRSGQCLPLDLGSLPKEVSTEQAARILGCSKDTVLKLKKAGLLEWRNAAPPGGARPIFRYTLTSVVKLRTTYEVDEPPTRAPKEPTRRRAKARPQFKHLSLDD
jgi:hypothetical protein